MKRFFKQIISCMVLAFIAVASVGYIINYRATGELSFTSRNTQVYSASDLVTHIYTLNPGDSFIALANFGDNDSIKIRFENDEGKEKIGFIHFSDCYTYEFPLSVSYSSVAAKPSIILSFKSSITFDLFLKEFIRSIEDYEVIGVYMEDSDYSEEQINLSTISHFCENQHIPYGFVSAFTDFSVQNYIDSKDVNAVFESYRILPEVFDIDAVLDSYDFDKNLSACIFRTSSVRRDNIQRYWIDSINSTHSISEEEILLMNLEESDYVTYASVSDNLKVEILDSYNSIESN